MNLTEEEKILLLRRRVKEFCNGRKPQAIGFQNQTGPQTELAAGIVELVWELEPPDLAINISFPVNDPPQPIRRNAISCPDPAARHLQTNPDEVPF